MVDILGQIGSNLMRAAGLNPTAVSKGFDTLTGALGDLFGGSKKKNEEETAVIIVDSGPQTSPSQSSSNSSDVDTSAKNDQTQSTTLDQSSNQRASGNTSGANNATIVVTPSAESSQDLKSESSSQNTVSQVLTTSGTSQSTSSQNLDFATQGSVVSVSPVLSIDVGDTYVTEAVSSANESSGGLPSWLVPVAALGVGGVVVWKIIGKKKKKKVMQ